MLYGADAEVVEKFHRDGYVVLRPLSNTAQSSNNSDETCTRKRPIDDGLVNDDVPPNPLILNPYILHPINCGGLVRV